MIYVNPSALAESSNVWLYTTMAHEGYPGHLYQQNYYQSTNPAPLRSVLNFPGYSEGWASYVEMESYALMPLGDPVAAQVQRINQEVTLLLYCQADIDVHYYGWSREELTEYLQMIGYEDEGYANAIFEAVVQDPANYLSYGVGCQEFKALREQTEQRLGEAFDVSAFHEVILRTGPAPFEVLEVQVNEQLSPSAQPEAEADERAAA